MRPLRFFLSALLATMLAAVPAPVPPTYTEVAVGLSGVEGYAVRWGDYDGDGDLDLLMSGITAGVRWVRVYRNDGGTFVEDPNDAGLLGLSEGSVIWGDFDNDGDLDIAYSGWSGGGTGSRIYRNDGNAWTQVGTLRGMKGADGVWFDYDNDGDLDLLLTGESYDPPTGDYTIIYRNDGNSVFTPAVSLPGTYLGGVSIGDYDHDGNLDIALTGRTVGTKIFRNNGDGTFTALDAAHAPFPALIASSVAWGDFDNDGDLDLIISGLNDAGVLVCDLYRNDNGTFVPMNAGIAPVRLGKIIWGDYDHDGFIDLFMVGTDAALNPLANLYRNNGDGTFTLVPTGITGVANQSRVDWGDFDNDGDLDIVLAGEITPGSPQAKVYRCFSSTPNTAPTAPTGPFANVFGNTLTFHWNAATDAQTPAAALTYNLRVGTTPGGRQIMSPMANVVTGQRQIAAPGNAQQNLQWTLRNLPPGTYYWSVQAIDNGYMGSGWAPEQSVSIGAPPAVAAMSPSPGSTVLSPPAAMTVTFTTPVDPATVTPATVRVFRAGPNGTLGNADDVAVVPTTFALAGGNQAQLDFTGVRMPRGPYRVFVSGSTTAASIPGAHWNLDEGSGSVAGDSAGVNHGTLVNGPAWITGKLGKALQFNGVDQSVDFPDNDLLSPHAGPAGEMTISAWVRLASLPASRAPIAAKGGDTDWEYALYVHGDGTVSFAMYQPDSTLYGEARGGSLSTGVWHHVAGTVKKGQFVNVYLDGLPVENQLALAGATSNLAAPLRIGRTGANPGPAEFLGGDVDDVQLFSSALTHVQVHTLATLGGAVRDLAGAVLDGEFIGPFPSGNGAAGGDFVGDFLVAPAQLQVTDMVPAPASVLGAPPADLVLTLNAPIDSATVSPATVRLVRAGPDGNLGTVDDVAITPSSISLLSPTQIRLAFSGVPLPNDTYRVTLSATTSSISGRVNYWPLDEGAGFTAGDFSGVAPGLLNSPVWRPGRIGNGLRFNGNGDRVTMGAPALATPWTAAMWVLREDSPAGDARLMDPPTFSGGSLRLESFNNTDKVGVAVYTVADYSSNFTAPVGQWVHLTFVGGAQTQVYVNGNLQDTLPPSFAVPRYYMGSHGYNSMLGTLDDVQIFGRNLAAAEIRTLASLGGAVRDVDGNRLDGEFGGSLPSGNNVEGGDFQATFTIAAPAPPGAFALLSPSNAATNVTDFTTCTWNASAGAASYTLEIALDSNFTSIVRQHVGLATTSFTQTSALARGTLHYWRVTAVNPDGTKLATNAPFSFTTIPNPPAAFTLVAPADTLTGVPANPTYSWNGAAGATSYTLEVSAVNNFSSHVINQSGIVTTSVTPSTSLGGSTLYYWRVTATNPGGSVVSNGGTPFSFTTAPAPPGSFTMTSPANGAVNVSDTPSFTWAAAPGTASYTFEMATDSNFVFLWGKVTGLLTPSFSIGSSIVRGTQYFWRVTAVNADGSTLATGAPFSFTTLPNAPANFSYVSPAPGATNISTSPTFSWTAASGATSYRLRVSLENILSFPIVDQIGIVTTSFTPPVTLAPSTPYYWQVTAVNTGGISNGGDGFPVTFTTSGGGPLAFALTAPTNSAADVTRKPTYFWEASPGASSYTLQVSKNAVFSTFVVNQPGIAATSFTPPVTLAAAETYYWRVLAVNGIGTTNSTPAPASFTTTSGAAGGDIVVTGGGCGLLGLEVLLVLLLRRRLRSA